MRGKGNDVSEKMPVTGPAARPNSIEKGDIFIAVLHLLPPLYATIKILYHGLIGEPNFLAEVSESFLPIILFTILGVAMFFWRIHPLPVYIITMAFHIIGIYFGNNGGLELTIIFVSISVVFYCSYRQAIISLYLAPIIVFIAYMIYAHIASLPMSDSVLKFAIFAACIFIGGLTGFIERNREENKAYDLEKKQKARQKEIDSALVRERQYLAAELHDIAAHYLAAIVVQASVVEELMKDDHEAA